MNHVFFRAILFLLLLSGALAGMTMIEPPCRGYPGSLNAPTDEPINRRDPWAAKTYPCQGYGKGPVQRSYRAGMSISTRFSGTSGRGQGGHCQFSLSYDGGKTFIVIRTILGSCLKGADRAYSIRLPKSAPSGDAIFSWTWYNAKGSRDMYQNCADIHIRGSVAGVLTGPRLLIAQLPGTPWIPEWSPASHGKDGRDLFNARPLITLSDSTTTTSSNRPSMTTSTSPYLAPTMPGTMDTPSPTLVDQTHPSLIAHPDPTVSASGPMDLTSADGAPLMGSLSVQGDSPLPTLTDLPQEDDPEAPAYGTTTNHYLITSTDEKILSIGASNPSPRSLLGGALVITLVPWVLM